jgi:steroid delta-isomerase-like uncharacterized protein
MTIDMEKLMQNISDAWNSHDVDKLLSLFAENCVYEDVPMAALKKGKEELHNFFGEFFVGFPDFKFEIRNRFSTAENICMEWFITGTHLGDLSNRPATGRTISARGVGVVEVIDGKISRYVDYYDMAIMLRQLGVAPAPPQV